VFQTTEFPLLCLLVNGHEDAMNRTSFISSIGAAAAVAFLKDVALADGLASSLPLAPLIETLLPLGSPEFPDVTGPMISDRIESLYHLGDSAAFAASLAMFMQPTSFLKSTAVLYAAEQSMDPHIDLAEMNAADARAYQLANLPDAKDFAALTPGQRTAYLRLWSHSAFNTRRRFYQSVRFLTFAAFYSLPQVWPAIGYAGPVLVTH
jgi:hypothetical protein